MESSQTLLRLGHIRARRSHRSISRSLGVLLRNSTGTSDRHVLSVLLLPVPTILHLRNIRLLLDRKMANLSVERRMGLPRKILAKPRPILQHHPRSEEHTSELQSRLHIVCRLLLEKKKKSDT